MTNKSPQADLFGQIPVTLREVSLWLFKVPRLAFHRRARDTYAAGYRVADKIAAAKQRGDLAEIFGDECCEFCGSVLALEFAALAPVSPASELDRLRRRVAVLEVLIRPGVEVPGRSVTSVS